MQCTKSRMSKSIFKLAFGDFALAVPKKMQKTKKKEKEMELFYSWTILEPTIKLTFKTFGVRDGIDNSWVSPQMWAMHISANHRYVETLHFLGFFLTFLLWNPCAFALVRLRSKNHLVRFSKRSCFGLKYLVWSPQKHLEISEVQKNMSQQ